MLDYHEMYRIFGIALSWALIHGGPYPHYIHPFHLKYCFGKEIEFKDIVSEMFPVVDKLVESIINSPSGDFKNIDDLKEWSISNDIKMSFLNTFKKNDLANYISQYEVINTHKQELLQFKEGFNKLDIIKINWFHKGEKDWQNLPKAETCFYKLKLCEDYDNNEIGNLHVVLNSVFSKFNEGFEEEIIHINEEVDSMG
ncbi:10413_t:CDS:2 [Entrophospora sp. SA101]|nr:10413_t:CDS:2 [Entrophospora sp. SA101]